MSSGPHERACGTIPDPNVIFFRQPGVVLGVGKPMRRREFIALLGSAAIARPLAVGAQPAVSPVIGFLSSVSPGPFKQFVEAFRHGLSETGFIEGQNITIEYRWADGHFDRLPALATDLVQHHVAVIVATGGPYSALAAKAATPTIPIVFNVASDPIKLGLVASLNHPGGNVTGVNFFSITVEPKKLEFLHQLVPTVTMIGVLVNPRNPSAETVATELETTAHILGLQLNIVKVATADELGPAFAALVQQGSSALLVAADPFFNAQRETLVALAAQHAIPAIYEWREFAGAGGLMSYGTNLSRAYHQVGNYTGRILKGEKPSEMPVMQPTKFELVINLKTAKALGLNIPDKLLALADEVIE
jgi:putative ABC transport system substrate-binding protein